MALNLRIPEHTELKPKITVFGVGGAGGNAVNNMIEKELDGVEFVMCQYRCSSTSAGSADSENLNLGLRVTAGAGCWSASRALVRQLRKKALSRLLTTWLVHTCALSLLEWVVVQVLEQHQL